MISLAALVVRRRRTVITLWLRATSRDNVDGARPSRPAVTRSDSPAARPREISSRSAVDSFSGDRFGSRRGDRFSRFTAQHRLVHQPGRRAWP